MADDRPTLHLVGLMHEAALDDEAWSPMLRELARATGSDNAAVFAIGSTRPGLDLLATHNFDPALVDAYRTTYAAIDPRTLAAAGRPSGRVYANGELVSETELRATRFYDGFWRHTGLDRGGGIEWRQGERRTAMSVYRRRGVPEHRPDQLDLLRQILPHLGTAMRTRGLLRRADETASATAAALDRLAHPVLVVRPDGRLVRANRAAERMVAAGAGLSTRCGRLVARDSADSDLRMALRRFATDPCPPYVLVSVPREGLPPLGLWLTPLALTRMLGGWALPTGRLVMIAISDPERRMRPPDTQLQALYGLTRAEARLVSALLAGENLKRYAEGHGITESTARWTLKQALHKTGSRRQSDLIRLILTGPAGAWLPELHDFA